MFTTRRAALTSTRRLRCRRSNLQRRFESHDSHNSHASDTARSQPVNESFGKGFYITIASIPLSIILYQYASSQSQSPSPSSLATLTSRLSSLIPSILRPESPEDLTRRTALHAAAVEQASLDRRLFTTSGAEPGSNAVDLFSPEATLNARSPINVAAGEQGADLRGLKKYYDDKYRAMEEERLERVRRDGGVVRTVYDTRSGWDRFKDKDRDEAPKAKGDEGKE